MWSKLKRLDDGKQYNYREIVLANSKSKLILSLSDQHAEHENRIRQHYP
jgi:hypothetical protein